MVQIGQQRILWVIIGQKQGLNGTEIINIGRMVKAQTLGPMGQKLSKKIQIYHSGTKQWNSFKYIFFNGANC